MPRFCFALLCFALLCLAIPNVNYADSCDALLQVGIYNISQSSSASEGQSLAKSTFCQADYSLSSISTGVQASIKASYGLFGGGASANVTREEIIQRQTEVCTLGFNASSYSNEASDYSKTIYQGALDAWNQCNALSLKGLKFELQTDNTLQGVAVSLFSAVGTSSKFTGLTQTGTGTSVCKNTSSTGVVTTLTESTIFPITSASKLNLICKRVLKKDTQGNLFVDAQALIFNTATGPYIVPLSRIGSLARATVDEVTSDIRAAVDADVQASLSIVNKTIADNRTESQNAISHLTSLLDTKISFAGLQCRDISTPPQIDGGGNVYYYLDRHDLKCSDNEYLTRFHLVRSDSSHIQLLGRCCRIWN